MDQSTSTVIVGAIGVVGTLGGALLGGHLEGRRNTAAREEAQREADRQRREKLHIDITHWALLMWHWFTQTAAGYDVPYPWESDEAHGMQLLVQVQLYDTTPVVEAFYRYHSAMLHMRELSAAMDLSEPPAGGPASLDVNVARGSEEEQLFTEGIAAYEALINTVRAERELEPLTRPGPPPVRGAPG